MQSDEDVLKIIRGMDADQLAKAILDLGGLSLADELIMLLSRWVLTTVRGSNSFEVYTGYEGLVCLVPKRVDEKGWTYTKEIMIDPKISDRINRRQFHELLGWVITGTKDRPICLHCFAQGCDKCGDTGWADAGPGDFGLDSQGNDHY